MRTLFRSALMLSALVGLTAVALVARQTPTTVAGQMATQSQKLLASLSAEQKAKATFGIDDPHRSAWFFTPQQDKQKQSQRKGLRIDGLDASQKKLVQELLRTGLSASGFEQANTIVSLESLLAELEGAKGAMTRDPNWYFVSIFGEPSQTGRWGWRFEGHHLSINFTLEKGEVVSSTPLLFGSNPAEVKSGAKKGLRPLPQIEELAKELIASLDEMQSAFAKQAKQLPEIKEGVARAGLDKPVGIVASELTTKQRGTLMKLVEAYANRLPEPVAKRELARVQEAGPEKIYFAYCVEPNKKGQPYTYRVHGPTFLVEFLNVQADSAGNPANHIHSGWRTLPADFALKQ
jgi:hypothetical protein